MKGKRDMFVAREDERRRLGWLCFGRIAKGALYQLTDRFTLFALCFLRGRVTDENYWGNTTNIPAQKAWCGIAFERVRLAHVPQVKTASAPLWEANGEQMRV